MCPIIAINKKKSASNAEEKKKKKREKLIPKPEGRIGRAGLQLVNAMGLGENHMRYNRLQVSVR